MAEAKFYYDQLMNNDLTTFSVYLYGGEGKSINNKRINRQNFNDYEESSGVHELLRGVISQNASMGTQVVWNGSPLNLSSAWANIATSLKSSSRNLANAANQILNAETAITSAGTGGILNWDQNSYYSINEFQKTFGGLTTSTPLTISAVILPYMKGTEYKSVKDQLRVFLESIYPGEEESDNPISQTSNKDESTGDKKSRGWLIDLLFGAAELISGGLNWASDKLDSITDKIFQDSSKYVLKIKPPHGYSGVPIDFVQDQWMANTLAIRIGSRQLFNLLISTVNVTVSKELTTYKGVESPSQAQIDLSFQPVTVLKPTEIREYILSELYNSSQSKGNVG